MLRKITSKNAGIGTKYHCIYNSDTALPKVTCCGLKFEIQQGIYNDADRRTSNKWNDKVKNKHIEK